MTARAEEIRITPAPNLTMREFFKGRQRKLGVMTLAIALLLLTAWMRSYVAGDVFSLRLRHSARTAVVYQAKSVHGGFELSRDLEFWTGDSYPANYPFRPEYFTAKATDFEWWPQATKGVDWFWYRCGFYAGGGCFVHLHSTELSAWFIISYSSIVLPLALFSAWLLLNKLRPAKKPTRTIEADEIAHV